MTIIPLSSQIGSPFSYKIKSDRATVYRAENLPSGWVCDPVSGVISGTTPALKRFSIAIMAATNGFATFAVLDITGTPPPVPVITSSETANAQIGASFNYQITASSSSPITSYSATNLPAWCSVDTATGLLSGTVTGTPLNTTITIGATNSNGTTTKNLIVRAHYLPAITSSLSQTAQKTVPFSYQITASGEPTSYSASNLPSGLTLNSSTGLISGTPTVSGITFTATITASNAVFTSVPASLVFTVNSLPFITSPLTATANYNQAFTYQLASSEYPAPTSFSASNLPQGLSINTSTGAITGTPTMSYSSPVSVAVSCTNSIGTATATLTLTVVSIQTTVGNHLIEVMDGSYNPGVFPRVEQTGYVYCVATKNAVYVSNLNSGTQWTKLSYNAYGGNNLDAVERWGGDGFRLYTKALVGSGPTGNINTVVYRPFFNNSGQYQYPTIGGYFNTYLSAKSIDDAANFYTTGPSGVRLDGLNTGFNRSAESLGWSGSKILVQGSTQVAGLAENIRPYVFNLSNRKALSRVFVSLNNGIASTSFVAVSKPVSSGSYSFIKGSVDVGLTWDIFNNASFIIEETNIDGDRGYSEVIYADNGVGVIMACGGAYGPSKAPGEKTMAIRYTYYPPGANQYSYPWFTFEVDPGSSFDSSNLYYFPATDRIYVTYGPNVYSCSASDAAYQANVTRSTPMTSLGFSWVLDTHPGTDPAGFPTGSRAFAKRLSQTANGGKYALVRYLGAEGAYPFQIAIGDANRTNWQISTITS